MRIAVTSPPDQQPVQEIDNVKCVIISDLSPQPQGAPTDSDGEQILILMDRRSFFITANGLGGLTVKTCEIIPQQPGPAGLGHFPKATVVIEGDKDGTLRLLEGGPTHYLIADPLDPRSITAEQRPNGWIIYRKGTGPR